ncbi:MAG: GNAT family N-acetyltransferase [Magnetococcales bacterium]|nr:GNAT family N-acetyltransferase [Magnetococcales bacterium]
MANPLDPQWTTRHAQMIATPEAAMQRIKPGQRVFVATGAAAPRVLLKALREERRRLADVEIVHLLTLGAAPYASKELQEIFSVNTFFVADNVRESVQSGLGDYTPIMLSDIPRLFESGRFPLDVALIQVSPPDANGMVSLGVSVDVVRSAAENAGVVIAQVNAHMPRTHGDSLIPVWDLDLLVPADDPLPEAILPPPDAALKQIGPLLAALIPDGATLQVGVGRAPQSLLPFLKEKKDLGLHTELITDSVLELLASGALTGQHKTLDRGRIVASFCLGSRKFYQALHDDPRFELRRTEYVNDPTIIARHHRMIAVNTALQIDLTGQVCVDSLGAKFYSGLGGVVNFSQGAHLAPEGKSIIALPATARGGKVSRIVDLLTPGAGVALTRGCVEYVVTEFGVAYLFGKTIQERAMALISIAHPDFRPRLLKRAIRLGFLKPELSEVDGRTLVGPQELRTSLLLDDGTLLTFRPSHPNDRKAIKETLYSLSEASVYKRFLSTLRRFPFQRIKNFVYIDHRRDVVMVGIIPEAYGEKIVAIGGYYLNPSSNRAEVAFLVRDDWQGRGIGTFLMRRLVAVAKRNGLGGLTAETLMDNRAMQAVLEKCGLKVSTRVEGDVMHFEMDF